VAARIRGIAGERGWWRPTVRCWRAFPSLRCVASFGVGYDHVDSAYAREHGIIVTHTPDVLTEEVADTALGLLIATLREFVRADRYLRSGQWETRGDYPLTRARCATTAPSRHRSGLAASARRWRAGCDCHAGAGGLSRAPTGRGRCL